MNANPQKDNRGKEATWQKSEDVGHFPGGFDEDVI